MEDKANDVIKQLIVAKGMMTTLMSYNPNTGEDTSLDSPINRPGHIGERARKEVEVIGRNIIEDRGNDQVMSNVRE
jgi:hypothetical protein